MKPRRQRMIFVGVVLVGVVSAAALVIAAIGENMLYFYSPTQLRAGDAPRDHPVRIGGLVASGSVRRVPGNLAVSFDVTDNNETVTVTYHGILPDLFREGQGIVTTGKLGGDGTFVASEVLAKHDENYMPPEVAEALELAHEGGRMAAPAKGTRP